MEKMNPSEPQSAIDYDDRTTAAVKTVLMEIGQILGSFHGKFVLIGGAVPWLLLNNEDMPHVGTLDIDLSLDAEALGDGEYTTLINALLSNGYEQNKQLRRFQLVRHIIAKANEPAISIIVDFLMPRNADIIKNNPPILQDFAVQRADGADLAFQFFQTLQLEGAMPRGGTNRVDIAICSIPALLAMKGYALKGRMKQKDAYDVYYCIRNYPDGIPALAMECKALLEHASGREGFQNINEKFETLDAYGPTSVRLFVEDSHILGDRTADQWQQDAFGQIDALLRALKLRS